MMNKSSIQNAYGREATIVSRFFDVPHNTTISSKTHLRSMQNNLERDQQQPFLIGFGSSLSVSHLEEFNSGLDQ